MSNLTPEQNAFVEELKNSTKNISLVAVAGSGKTYTLVHATQHIPKSSTALACAFNKKNAEDLAARMPDNVQCKTFNAIGHRAWAQFTSKRLNLNIDKIAKISKPICYSMQIGENWGDVMKLVRAIRMAGIVPEHSKFAKLAQDRWTRDRDDIVTYIEDLADEWEIKLNDAMLVAIDETLIQCIEESFAGTIDFDDQIYMTVCWNAPLTQYDVVLVDEAQDLNSFQHIMVERSKSLKGRIVAVGDPNQAIYAWRGALSDSMQQFENKFSMERMPLTVNFRCGNRIIDLAQTIVPAIRAWDGASPGHIDKLPVGWDVSEIPDGATVLCRNNAPLLRLAFKFLKAGRPAQLANMDFKKILSNVVDKYNKETPGITIKTFLVKFSDDIESRIRVAKANAQLSKIDPLQDRLDAMFALAAMCKPTDPAIKINQELNRIFNANASNILLSTIHKAKGLEWDMVYFLNSFQLPSIYAISASALQQELNLYYVAVTRAKHQLIYIDDQPTDKRDEQLYCFAPELFPKDEAMSA